MPTPVVFEDPLDEHKKITKDSTHNVRLANLTIKLTEIGARMRLMQMD